MVYYNIRSPRIGIMLNNLLPELLASSPKLSFSVSSSVEYSDRSTYKVAQSQ